MAASEANGSGSVGCGAGALTGGSGTVCAPRVGAAGTAGTAMLEVERELGEGSGAVTGGAIGLALEGRDDGKGASGAGEGRDDATGALAVVREVLDADGVAAVTLGAAGGAPGESSGEGERPGGGGGTAGRDCVVRGGGGGGTAREGSGGGRLDTERAPGAGGGGTGSLALRGRTTGVGVNSNSSSSLVFTPSAAVSSGAVPFASVLRVASSSSAEVMDFLWPRIRRFPSLRLALRSGGESTGVLGEADGATRPGQAGIA